MRRSMLLAIAALGLMAALPPTPKRPTGGMVLHVEAAFTKLWAVYSVSVTGGADSLVTIVRSTGKTDTRRKYTTASKTDSVDVGFPVAGASTTVAAYVIAFKFGKGSDTVTIGSATVNGDAPVPSGTLKLTPASVLLKPGQSTGLTATLGS